MQDSEEIFKPEFDCELGSQEEDDEKSEMSERTRRDNNLMLDVFDENVAINKSKRQIKTKLATLSLKRRCKFQLFIFCFILELNTQFLPI